MILGITGTIGAGKGTVVEYLKKKGFIHYAARDFIVEEIKRRGLPVNRDSMTLVANDLRHIYGPAYIISTLLARAEKSKGNAVIESVRVVAEAQVLKEHGAVLLAIDSNQKTRYERITKRGSETDHIDFDTFVAQEAREMENENPEKQNISVVMMFADYHIDNKGVVEELHKHIDHLLTQVHAR